MSRALACDNILYKKIILVSSGLGAGKLVMQSIAQKGNLDIGVTHKNFSINSQSKMSGPLKDQSSFAPFFKANTTLT